MATPGQPTLYKPEYCELAHNYYLLGATNELLGDFFGVARRTIQNWIAAHADFADGCAGPLRRRCQCRPRPVRACQGLQPQGLPHHALSGKEQTVTNTVSYPPDSHVRALRCFAGPKRAFSVAMASENSVNRLKFI